VTVFLYSKVRHRRTETPPVFTDYHRYKPFLRVEFLQKCVYCRAADTPGKYEMFGVDHYRPKKHFDELRCTYSNLFYACNPCNRRKDEFWADDASEKFIPNPCDHVMFDHLRFVGASVEAHSVAGEWTIDLLDLNEEASVLFRENIITLVKLASDTRRALERDLQRVRTAFGRESGAERRRELELARNQLTEELTRVENSLVMLGGVES